MSECEIFEYDYHQDNADRQPRARQPAKKLVIRSGYDKIQRVISENRGPDLCEQHHEDACNIHTILDRFQRTGTIEHMNRNAGQYGYATSEDLLGAHILMEKAKAHFESLPATVRDQFDGIGHFLDEMNNMDLSDPEQAADQLLQNRGDLDPKSTQNNDDGATEEARPIDPT